MLKGKRLIGPIRVETFWQIGFGGVVLLDERSREIVIEVVLFVGALIFVIPFWQNVWTEEEIEEGRKQAQRLTAILGLLDFEDPLVSHEGNPYPMLRELGLELLIQYELEGQVSYIPWSGLEEFFAGTEDWSQEKFNDFMTGQTVVAGGPYPWDVERFFQRLPVID